MFALAAASGLAAAGPDASELRAHFHRLRINVAGSAGHTVSDEQVDMALEWLERWLKP